MDTTAAPFDGRILFQNSACMVINKLPGEPSEFPENKRQGKGETTAGAGKKTGREEKSFPFTVHRLDTPVSGCLLLAKTLKAAAFLSSAFARPASGAGSSDADPAIEKLYWAIAEKPKGEKPFPIEGELVHWLYENKKANKSYAHPFFDAPASAHCHGTEGKTDEMQALQRRYGEPKKAVLRCRIIGEGERYLFLEINLVTGRHHQIRAQLAAVGLHIKGDLKYGARRSEKGGGIRLHAYSLAFPDPENPSETIQVKANPRSEDALWLAFKEAYAGN